MICPKCDQDYTETCECGYRPKVSREQKNPEDFLRMKSGNQLLRCTWIIRERCCLPVTGSLPGQPPLCAWHRTWMDQLGTARALEERIERPAYDAWWDWRAETYHQPTLWGLSKEEYWRYSHGQRIHDPKPESLPAIQEPPAYMTKEEFGVDLFEAIRLQAGQMQARTTATVYRGKGLDKEADRAIRIAEDLQRQLQAIFQKNTIAPADLRRLQKIQ